jgi:hypothetical protein
VEAAHPELEMSAEGAPGLAKIQGRAEETGRQVLRFRAEVRPPLVFLALFMEICRYDEIERRDLCTLIGRLKSLRTKLPSGERAAGWYSCGAAFVSVPIQPARVCLPPTLSCKFRIVKSERKEMTRFLFISYAFHWVPVSLLSGSTFFLFDKSDS